MSTPEFIQNICDLVEKHSHRTYTTTWSAKTNDGKVRYSTQTAVDMLCAAFYWQSARWRLVNDLERKEKFNAINIGIDTGFSSYVLASIYPQFHVYTFDIRDSCTQLARAVAADLKLKNLTCITGTSADVHKYTNGFCFAFVDGDHSIEGCYTDLKNLHPLATHDALILCHDYMPWLDGRPNRNGVHLGTQKFLQDYPEWHGLQLCWWCMLSKEVI